VFTAGFAANTTIGALGVRFSYCVVRDCGLKGTMARKPRVEFAGAFYHVICRGNQRQVIFQGDADRAVQVVRSGLYTCSFGKCTPRRLCVRTCDSCVLKNDLFTTGLKRQHEPTGISPFHRFAYQNEATWFKSFKPFNRDARSKRFRLTQFPSVPRFQLFQ